MSRQRSFAVTTDGDNELAAELLRIRQSDASGGLICAANHATFLDAPLLATYCERFVTANLELLMRQDRCVTS